MKKTYSLNKNSDFRRIYAKGKNGAFKNFVIYFRRTKNDFNHLGITASKKIGNAVQRNRARRLIKESYRILEDRLDTGYEIVFVARVRTPRSRLQYVKKDMETAFRKFNMLKKSRTVLNPEENNEHIEKEREL